MTCTKGRKKSGTHQGTKEKAVTEEVHINIITPEKWETYIGNLYDTRAGATQDYEDNIHKEQLQEEDNIAPEKVHEALVKLKDRKAPDSNQIVNEMLKYGGSKLETVIT
ncbi:hypothetical protein Trydic_g21533 [Trypoxylus dichotomus]